MNLEKVSSCPWSLAPWGKCWSRTAVLAAQRSGRRVDMNFLRSEYEKCLFLLASYTTQASSISLKASETTWQFFMLAKMRSNGLLWLHKYSMQRNSAKSMEPSLLTSSILNASCIVICWSNPFSASCVSSSLNVSCPAPSRSSSANRYSITANASDNSSWRDSSLGSATNSGKIPTQRRDNRFPAYSTGLCGKDANLASRTPWTFRFEAAWST
mmetsp:Transcript_16245/g.38946  ORF Transcript_16245/g.38946 Transcript_16245/m.38946 type:complete len:213 (-) Transcript_16245:253-891(-)